MNPTCPQTGHLCFVLHLSSTLPKLWWSGYALNWVVLWPRRQRPKIVEERVHLGNGAIIWNSNDLCSTNGQWRAQINHKCDCLKTSKHIWVVHPYSCIFLAVGGIQHDGFILVIYKPRDYSNPIECLCNSYTNSSRRIEALSLTDYSKSNCLWYRL